MKSTPSDFILEIDRKRREAGWSQAGLAAACNMTQGHYSKIVAGKVPLSDKATRALARWNPDFTEKRPAPPRLEELAKIATKLRRDAARLEELLERAR